MLTWQELRSLSDAELSKQDLAAMNLACATELPGIDQDAMDTFLARLDRWTERVRTAQGFGEPNGKSLAYCRVQRLVDVLRDAMRAEGSISAGSFLTDDQGADILLLDLLKGTSCSRSAFLVLCVAIGRRLGYPLKLLATRGEKFFYLFARWDEGKEETFNIDVNADGFCSHPDEHYSTGQYELPPRVVKKSRMRTPLKPQEELAFFLGGRGFKWEALGDYRKALDAFAWASAINTWNPTLRQMVTLAIQRWRTHLKTRFPYGFPTLNIGTTSRRYPMSFSFEQEQAIILNETIEMLLGTDEFEKKYWEPLRRGLPMDLTPVKIQVVHTATGSQVKVLSKDTSAAAARDRIVEMLNPGFLKRRHAEAESYRRVNPPKETPQTDSEKPKPVPDGPLTIERLIRMSDEERDQIDIAEMNLVCAKGLPGTHDLDIPACLRKIDEWAGFIRDITKRNEPIFASNRKHYDNSWATFRIVNMVLLLKSNFGVKYNEDRKKNLMGDDFFNRPEDVFLHGILSGNGGTCTSIPVLCVAVGRRLGYPLTLVHTQGHQFFRWVEPGGERLNFEATGDLGLNAYPDEYYRHWPVEVPPLIEEKLCHLQNKKPRQDLSGFLMTRSHCWLGNGNYSKSLKCVGWSSLFDMENSLQFNVIFDLLRKWKESLWPRLGKRLPLICLKNPKRVWYNLPWEMERQIVGNCVLEDLLRDYRFKKLVDRVKQRGKLPDWAPKQITVTYSEQQMFAL